MTWLVLAQDGDPDARWMAGQLRRRAGTRVELIEASTLVHDCRWEHRVGAAGTSSRLVVDGSTVIDSAEVGAVLNRLSWLSADGFEGASPGDREYAAGELFALALSWLESLGPRVLNRPSGLGLSGAWRTAGQWRSLARTAGLAVVPYDSGQAAEDPVAGDRTALLVDGHVIEARPDGGLDPDLRRPLGDLQRRAGLDLMEVSLDASAAVRGVSYLPPLHRYGPPAVAAVRAALRRRSRAARPAAPDLAAAR
jgi:hypothetical protein